VAKIKADLGARAAGLEEAVEALMGLVQRQDPLHLNIAKVRVAGSNPVVRSR